MIIPCEVAAKSVVPAIKALMAKELVEKRGLKQNQVADILGISQSAVSKYTQNVRGSVLKIDDIEEIRPIISNMITLLASEKSERTQFLELFCETCTIIRKKSRMCQFCQKADSKIDARKCGFCLRYAPFEAGNGNEKEV